jgi:hypothetical protein
MRCTDAFIAARLCAGVVRVPVPKMRGRTGFKFDKVTIYAANPDAGLVHGDGVPAWISLLRARNAGPVRSDALHR